MYDNFIEYTTVEAKGNVEANIIMKCNIKAGKDIVISGKRGAVVGGDTYCVGTLATTFLGNSVGVKTIASVGINAETEKRNHLLRVKAESTKASLAKTLIEIQSFKDSVMLTESRDVREAKIKQLQRRKIRDERLLEHVNKELEKIKETMDVAKAARIIIKNMVYSDTTLRTDGTAMEVKMRCLLILMKVLRNSRN